MASAASTTAGQAFANAFPCSGWTNAVWVGGKVASKGTITKFSRYAGATSQTVQFLVLRPSNQGAKVVAVSSPVNEPGDSALHSYAVTIPVEAGDLIADWAPTASSGPFYACYGNGTSAQTMNKYTTDGSPAVGETLPAPNTFAGTRANLAATIEPEAATVTGTGSNNPNNGEPNQFSISSVNQTGNLNYTSTTKSFAGAIQCVNIVGNSATIVAIDYTTGKANQTMVQDNGAAGDKLVNTMFDPSKLSAKTRAKYLSCVTPDLARLSAANALTGDVIHVTGTTSPAAL
jgi:hypothetical protein